MTHIGYFAKAEDAARAWDRKAIELRGINSVFARASHGACRALRALRRTSQPP